MHILLGIILVFAALFSGNDLVQEYLKKGIIPSFSKNWIKYIALILAIVLSLYNIIDSLKLDEKLSKIDYSTFSNYNALGINENVGISSPTNFSHELFSVFKIVTTDGAVNVGLEIDCSTTSLSKLKELVSNNIDNPYSHYYYAGCLQLNNNTEWKNEAEEAYRVFGFTTKIQNHHTDQDVSIQILKSALETNSPIFYSKLITSYARGQSKVCLVSRTDCIHASEAEKVLHF